MTSEPNNIDTSNAINLSTDKKEDSLDASSIKDIVLNTIRSPETMKALAEVLGGMNKPSNNEPVDNRLKAEIAIDEKIKKENEIKSRDQELANWYKVQATIKSLPYTHENKKSSVLKTLEGICTDVDNESKDLSRNRASNLSKLAVLKAELDVVSDPNIRYHPKYNQIKDLFEQSNVEAGIIVAEDLLEEMYVYTTTQMKIKEDQSAEAEKVKLNQHNKNEGLSYEIDFKNIPLVDGIKYRLHGASRYNKNYKDVTMEDYHKISKNKNHDYNVYKVQRDIERERNTLVI